MRRVHLLVSGIVQGVGYRWNAVRQAESLGLTGWVRNRADGRVECEAQGPAPAVASFIAWTRQGPRHAEVEDVAVADLPPRSGEDGFACADDA